jgi:glycosyltransferase involved in cell wall biosynthesis
MSEEIQHQYITPAEIGSVEGDLMHAHRWFECGEAAHQYASTKNVPYIVDVVQADLQKFRKSLFGRQSAEKILAEASRVVFTAPVQEDVLAQHLPSKVADTVFAKSTLLHEPLDPYWIENLHIHPPTALVHIKLLYVGILAEESRLDETLHAMRKLQKHNYMITLTAVETPEEVVESRYRQKMMAEAGKLDCFQVLRADTDEQLRDIYRNHDILLLPEADTTRRYAEAISQGLPVIYARESIANGIFKEGQAGYAVNFSSTDEIARTILNVSNFFGTIEQEIMRLHPLCQFDAKEQARHWVHLYENAARRSTVEH